MVQHLLAKLDVHVITNMKSVGIAVSLFSVQLTTNHIIGTTTH